MDLMLSLEHIRRLLLISVCCVAYRFFFVFHLSYKYEITRVACSHAGYLQTS